MRAYNQDLAIASSEDLADGVIQIDGYDYVGYLRYPSVQRRAYESQRLCRKQKPSVEGTIKTSTGIPQVEAQARVTPEVAPAFPSS